MRLWQCLQILRGLLEVGVHWARRADAERFELIVFQLGLGLRHLVRDTLGVTFWLVVVTDGVQQLITNPAFKEFVNH
jgi:hypothetical protein